MTVNNVSKKKIRFIQSYNCVEISFEKYIFPLKKSYVLSSVCPCKCSLE